MAKETYSSWSDLQDDILVSVLGRLCSIDVMRLGLVCKSWSKVVQSWQSSSSFTPKYAAPWLTYPVEQDVKEEDMDETKDGCLFLSFEEKKLFKAKKICKGFGKSRCIGSSHGWLVLLDEWAGPYLINPWTREQIILPSLNFLEDVVEIVKSRNVASVRHILDPLKIVPMSLQQFQVSFIYKAILSADPSHSTDFGVILIYNKRSKIGFSKYGVEWKDLDGADASNYHDIICKNNQVFALTFSYDVEVWNFSKYYPEKEKVIKNGGLWKMYWENYFPMFPFYSFRSYLVESMGHILLVLRVSANFVNEFSLPVPNIHLDGSLPYKTVQFHVYKLDTDLNQCVLMNSLGDCVLFLGGNHSTSLSTQDFPQFRKNSIYFTDDNWHRINEAQTYGGHDLGIFNLRENNVGLLLNRGKRMIRPPPIWLAPNPWKKKI